MTADQERIVEAYNFNDLIATNGIVVGSAAMAMHGIERTPADVDILVTPEIESQIWLGYVRQVKAGIIPGKPLLQVVDLINPPSDHLYKASFEELLNDSTEIMGVAVLGLGRLLAWKKAVARPKDLDDVATIETFQQRRKV